MFPVAGAFGAFSSTGPQCVRRGLPSPQPPRCKQHLAVPTHLVLCVKCALHGGELSQDLGNLWQ